MFDMLVRLCRLNEMKQNFIKASSPRRKLGNRTRGKTQVLEQSRQMKVQRRWCLFLTWRPYKTAVDIVL